MISMICFSQNGWKTGEKIKKSLADAGVECRLDGKSRYLPQSMEISHAEWTRNQWQCSDAIIFIGACGIAVRSIAPFVASKKTDPAVLVVDEHGNYVISLLSGHLGGANELAFEVAGVLGAQPIVTTATDLNQKFAVDVFARKNNCSIFPMSAAKEVSASLLAGNAVGFYSEFPVEGSLPEGLVPCDRTGNSDAGIPKVGIAVSIYRDCSPFEITVHLVPRMVSLGIGCRKDKDGASILRAAERCLRDTDIYQEALANIASIELKKEEAGLLELAERWNVPFLTYSEEILKQAEGEFSTSDFVKGVTGVDNVCERSAVTASSQGILIQKKHSENGVTTAMAVGDGRLYFE